LGSGLFRIRATKEGYQSVIIEKNVSQFKNKSIDFMLNKILPLPEKTESMKVFEKGIELYGKERYEEALTKFQEFFSANPTVTQVRVNIANCYRQLVICVINNLTNNIFACKLIFDEQNNHQNHPVSRGKECFGSLVAWPEPSLPACPARPDHFEIGRRYVQSRRRPRIADLASHRPVVARAFFGSPLARLGKRRPSAGSLSENLAEEN